MTETIPDHQVHLEIGGGPQPWAQYVKVNGHMLACESATLEIDASQMPVLTVKLPVMDGMVVGLDNPRFAIEKETRAALVAMGWAPPGEAVRNCPVHPQITGQLYIGDPVCTCDPPVPTHGISASG